MTEPDSRTGPARDVPPPRPVVGDDGAGTDGGGMTRAARAVADAVARLMNTAPTDDERSGATAGPPDAGARKTAAGVLRDVVGAVASAAGSLRGGSPAGEDGGRGPAAVLGDLLSAAGPRLPIRDADRLRAAYPGRSDEQIADALVARAGRMTAGVGAATGGLSAAQWFAPPSLLVLPLEFAAETVLIAAVEVVLVGELHELYGRPAPGDARQRASAYLASWSSQRAVDGTGAGTGLVAALGGAGLRELRRRLSRRLVRAVPSAAPFLLGAAIAARGNRRATEALARRVRDDLRRGPRRREVRG